ncbi:agmatine deiminase family protein [Halorhodospira sp. 9621]|uniref:agmatine deiminase family protein n=1 Tax=Halorhodospira TaxID=85108 RepID=UPI0019126CCE|nr:MULTISPECIES: agmatine deiminase family protein [Halorhodospira]MBK5936849.1 agmatine deiminase [Halorhodospira halophila]MBK5942294.1 agmatine deiminase [Halorhodospira halophila]MCG5531845.1 agmatine deiminase family protein [Halorhodospira sp. 9621]
MSAPVHPDCQHPRLPAEWERQAALMLTWPHSGGDWGEHLAAAEANLERLAAAAAQYQPVLVVCPDSRTSGRVRNRLRSAGVPAQRLIFSEAPSDDVWARDHGPITVLRAGGRAQLLDFRFNGWGGRYAAAEDDRLTRRLTEEGVVGGESYRRIEWILEGGSIDSDGAGTLLTTSRCLLNPNRNKDSGREEVEAQLRARLGVRRVLWLESGWLCGDDTDGHVDMLARFVDRHTIAHAVCEDRDDPHHAPLEALRAELSAARTLHGEPYRLIELPLPAPIHDENGNRLPATYANFVFINGAVLVPVYDDPADAVACARLAQACPDRDIVRVPARDLIRQGGSIHCATMQLPEGVIVDGLAAPTAGAGRVHEA